MSFADGETPTGTRDGVNAAFTLTNAPNPALSLELYKNGQLMIATVDYTLATATITYSAGAIPLSTDNHRAWYRY